MWQVFISHRGPDTKQGFVAGLVAELPWRRVFVDKDGLLPGDPSWQTIQAALRSSTIVVVVLSPGFQKSSYCLEELRIALERPNSIRLVFYDVKPGDVDETALQRSLETLREAQLRREPDEIVLHEWREAIRRAGEITGWEYDSTNYGSRDLRNLQKEVAQGVEGALPCRLLDWEGGKVGIPERVDAILNQYPLGKTHVLGLAGMGGIGKTTLAKALFDRIRAEFKQTCYIKDIRATIARKNGAESLQKAMMRDLADHDVRPRTEEEGQSDLRQWLSAAGTTPFLMLLDDVDGDDMGRLLLGDAGSWPPIPRGSYVIITSRNNSALQQAECHVQDVDLLNDASAWELFLACAQRRQPIYTDVPSALVTEVVKSCSGLPLSLKVMGTYLGNKTPNVWKKGLLRLRAADDFMGNERVFRQLRISYDGLCDQEKQLFLDVATVMVGWKREDAEAIWEARFPSAEFQYLTDQYLIKVDEQGRLGMHDQLRDMGRAIEVNDMTCERKRWEDRRRIWDCSTERGLDAATFDWSQCSRLRLLDLAGGSFATLPASFTQLTELQLLDMCRCKLLTVLPAGLGALTALACLDLGGCFALTALPDSLGALTGLTRLELRGCYALAAVPAGIGALTGLTSLCINTCKLDAAPAAIVALTGLASLDLDGCSRFKEIPEGLGRLTELTSLSLIYCYWLRELPHSLAALTALERLNLNHCHALAALPDGVTRLRALSSLALFECRELTALPQGIGALTRLTHLELSKCPARASLPDSLVPALSKGIGGLPTTEGYECRAWGAFVLLEGAAPLPEGAHLATTQEVEGSWDHLRGLLGPWYIVQLADGCCYGPGYGSSIARGPPDPQGHKIICVSQALGSSSGSSLLRKISASAL